MGGPVPLGYRVEDRKLVIVPSEAETVRHIMRRYLESANVFDLLDKLRADGVVSKVTVGRDGTVRGGKSFTRGAVFHLLANPVYIGLTRHRDKTYPGQHEAIVGQELFDAVKARLAERSNPVTSSRGKRAVSLLAGMIHDEHRRPMSPLHTFNHGRRYGYYASHPGDGSRELVLRLPAGQLDGVVRTALQSLLSSSDRLRQHFDRVEPADFFGLVEHCAHIAEQLRTMTIAEARQLLVMLKLEVMVNRSTISASICPGAVLSSANIQSEVHDRIPLEVPTTTASFGHEQRLRLDAPTTGTTSRDVRLLELIARGFAYRDQLLAMTEAEIAALPTTRYRHLERTARLAYLAPDIIRSILDGRQPTLLNARKLVRLSSLPLTWSEQRAMLGFAAA